MQARNVWKDQERTENMKAALPPKSANQTPSINQAYNYVSLPSYNKRDAELGQVAQRLLENKLLTISSSPSCSECLRPI